MKSILSLLVLIAATEAIKISPTDLPKVLPGTVYGSMTKQQQKDWGYTQPSGNGAFCNQPAQNGQNDVCGQIE